MIHFDRFVMDNGLRVLVHKDDSTPLACVNLLYDVGSRDEDPDKTGFAHLFEHLMFGGSVNIPNYDEPLQRVGGENNAFTSNDITNYYLTVPKDNLETAFWLESDRMLSLAFSEKSLDVQRHVVIEEFKQRYLNQPYGDVWLILRPLAYQVHPYRWATIGKEISHIENASIEDVKDFFNKYYCPNNAIMVVAGDVELDEVKRLSQKWFGNLPRGPENPRNLPQEPKQTEARTLTVKRDVPFNAIYKTFNMCSRADMEYYTVDIISDILSRGSSSRLHIELVKKKRLFGELNAYLSGDLDNGLFIISGKLLDGISIEEAEEALEIELNKLKTEIISETELTKVKNKIESTLVFSEMEVLNKAMSLAVAELMGDPGLINRETGLYLAVTAEEIQKEAVKIFDRNNSSTLYYLKNDQ
jgi:zinc protease